MADDLIRRALAKVRNGKRTKDGKLSNKELGQRCSQMLRWLRQGDNEQAHYQAKKILAL
jgi:hypothetical protein